MKKIIIFCILIISELSLYSQSIEKLGIIQDIHFVDGIAGGPGSPNELSVNEVDEQIKIINKYSDFTYYDMHNLKGISKEKYRSAFTTAQVELGNYDISFYDEIVRVENGKLVKQVSGGQETKSGISFILKKDSGYIVYYVNERGIPGAVDTKGKIYGNVEAIEYLKKYDPEKYEHSEKRAEELGLKEKFDLYEVLIWGDTYYTTTKIMESFYGRKDPYIENGLIQYDRQGYGYQLSINYEKSYLCIVNPNGTRHKLEVVEGYKNLIKDDNSSVSSSWYVGFGGNIYYYIAGKEYTGVFRIRRTWGNPDFYAMAVNGYTNDEYGKYVDEVLPKMSKADLRLLRNTIFALYGVHFKSEDLAKYFDKQVWYTDEGKTSGEVTLPENRQKLVEMIQKLEK